MELGFRDSSAVWDVQSYPVIFPDFARVAPMLRDLRIIDSELRVCELVDLPTSDGRCTLERFKLHTNLLSPDLVEKMPDLKFLELHLSVTTDNMA